MNWRSSLRFVTSVVAAVALVAGSAGCARVVDGRAVLASPRVGDPVQWDKCKFNADVDDAIKRAAECGRIAVPVDYAKPDGDVAVLALVRFPAKGKKIGSLVVNPGGPGESGIEAAVSMLSLLPDDVRDRFDLVGFDPRGVGLSTPALWCNTDEDNDRLRADNVVAYTPEGVAHIDGQTKEFIQRCVDKMGKEFLENIGTVNVAKDLDAIRAGLGDDKLTYLGYSYGTRIGAEYAEQFPTKVRAMILDGAVDPNADPVQSDLDQAAAFQKAFDNFAADCAKSSDCPLGTDPAKAVDVYKSLIDPLVDKPARTKDPRGLSYSDAVVATIMALYSPNLWRHLENGLAELRTGRGDTLLVLADMYMRRDAKGHYTNSSDARVAVNCVDQPAITDPATIVDEDRRMRQVAPFMSYGEFTGRAPTPTCALWPVPPTSKPHKVSAPGLPPPLVVSTTHDPATPYQAGVDLAQQLGGALLTFEGTQHTVVFQGNKCVDDYSAAYLLDNTLPPPGAVCR